MKSIWPPRYCIVLTFLNAFHVVLKEVFYALFELILIMFFRLFFNSHHLIVHIVSGCIHQCKVVDASAGGQVWFRASSTAHAAHAGHGISLLPSGLASVSSPLWSIDLAHISAWLPAQISLFLYFSLYLHSCLVVGESQGLLLRVAFRLLDKGKASDAFARLIPVWSFKFFSMYWLILLNAKIVRRVTLLAFSLKTFWTSPSMKSGMLPGSCLLSIILISLLNKGSSIPTNNFKIFFLLRSSIINKVNTISELPLFFCLLCCFSTLEQLLDLLYVVWHLIY